MKYLKTYEEKETIDKTSKDKIVKVVDYVDVRILQNGDEIYDSINEGKPDIGDYIVLDLDDAENAWLDNYKKIKNFFYYNIGQIVNSDFNGFEPEYTVQYLMKNKFLESFRLQNGFDENEDINIFGSDIKFWSKNKEDIEIAISAKKYNL